MIDWHPRPLWELFEDPPAVHQVTADDTLTLALREYARPPRLPTERSYRNLDVLRSQLRQGYRGVIVGWR